MEPVSTRSACIVMSTHDDIVPFARDGKCRGWSLGAGGAAFYDIRKGRWDMFMACEPSLDTTMRRTVT